MTPTLVDRDAGLVARCHGKFVRLDHRAETEAGADEKHTALQRIKSRKIWYEGACPQCGQVFQTKVDEYRSGKGNTLELVTEENDGASGTGSEDDEHGAAQEPDAAAGGSGG